MVINAFYSNRAMVFLFGACGTEVPESARTEHGPLRFCKSLDTTGRGAHRLNIDVPVTLANIAAQGYAIADLNKKPATEPVQPLLLPDVNSPD